MIFVTKDRISSFFIDKHATCKALFCVVKLLMLFYATGAVNNLSYASLSQHPIQELVKQAVIEKLGDDAIIVDVKLEQDPELLKLIQKQQYVNNVELQDFELTKNFTRLKFNLDDKSSILINAGINISKSFVSTARGINRNEIIQEEDLRSIDVNLHKIDLKNYLTKDRVIGMQARRNLPVGILLKKQDLISPIVIKANDVVNIIYEGHNFKLQSSATALNSGAVGDNVKLKIGDGSKNILVGKILDKDTVLINAKN
jgi:flagella basal body P-ring formation protein FlgA